MISFFQNELDSILGKREETTDSVYIGRACFIPLDDKLKLKAELISTSTHNQYDALRLDIIGAQGKVDSVTLRFDEFFKQQKTVSGTMFTPHIWNDNGFKWYGNPTDSDRKALSNEVSKYITTFSSPEMIAQRQERFTSEKLFDNFQRETEAIENKYGYDSIVSTPSFQCDQTLGCPTILSVCWGANKAWLSLPYYVYDGEPEDVRPYEIECAKFGIRNCSDYEDFNNILKELGDTAEMYCVYESNESEDIGINM